MTAKHLTFDELNERRLKELAELDAFYAELRNAKSPLAHRALTHINALVNELHGACQLLAKYHQHVGDCEGTDFLGRLNDHTQSDVIFTPAEVAALLALRG